METRLLKGCEESYAEAARLLLADATRIVLKDGMTLIGCAAPEKM